MTAHDPHSRYFNAMTHVTNHAPHILLVEDDREIRALVSRFLQGNDMRVSAVGDGRDMDRLLRDNRIDLIVPDVMLPERTAWRSAGVCGHRPISPSSC